MFALVGVYEHSYCEHCSCEHFICSQLQCSQTNPGQMGQLYRKIHNTKTVVSHFAVPAGNVIKLSFCKNLTPTPLQGRGNWNGAAFELKPLILMTFPGGAFATPCVNSIFTCSGAIGELQGTYRGTIGDLLYSKYLFTPILLPGCSPFETALLPGRSWFAANLVKP